MARLRIAVGIILLGIGAEAIKHPSSAPFGSTYLAASFVPPASPTQTRLSPPYSSMLFLSKKKTASAASGHKKMQVKLLKHVAGTGQAGDVIMVTPAFFQNKLRPTKSATPISEDEVKKAEMEAKQGQQATFEAATALQETLSDYKLFIKRKAGPEGQLFGGVSAKVILEELRTLVKDEFLNEKPVRIESVTQDGKKFRGDIKHVGEFGAKLSLTKDISAKINIYVMAEE